MRHAIWIQAYPTSSNERESEGTHQTSLSQYMTMVTRTYHNKISCHIYKIIIFYSLNTPALIFD